MRVHRSIVVNVARIGGLELQASGEYELVLRSKVRLRMSRRYRRRLQERMDTMSCMP
jgi:DNA-binding LytR/AlgR family response regulator